LALLLKALEKVERRYVRPFLPIFLGLRSVHEPGPMFQVVSTVHEQRANGASYCSMRGCVGMRTQGAMLQRAKVLLQTVPALSDAVLGGLVAAMGTPIAMVKASKRLTETVLSGILYVVLCVFV
jgi:hypothetical protein